MQITVCASNGEKVVNDACRATREQYSTDEKKKIVLDGLKGEYSAAGSADDIDPIKLPSHWWSRAKTGRWMTDKYRSAVSSPHDRC